MGNAITKYSVRLTGLLAIQILILNNIHLGGNIIPFIYVMFILMLPFEIKGWIMLIVSFFLGITMDMFSNSPGMHTSASLLMAFARPAVIRLISPKTNYGPDTEPTIASTGPIWLLVYSFTLVLIHHLTLFFLEVFTFREIFSVLLRAILSTIASVFVIMLTYFLINKPKRTRHGNVRQL